MRTAASDLGMISGSEYLLEARDQRLVRRGAAARSAGPHLHRAVGSLSADHGAGGG